MRTRARSLARSWIAARPSLGAWLLLAGCGDGKDGEPVDTDVPDTDIRTDTDPDTDTRPDTDPDTDVGGPPPEIHAASIRSPGANIRYARWLDVETNEPCKIHAAWVDGAHALEVTTGPELLQSQSVAVIGLRPGGSYTLTVTAINAANVASEPTTLTVDSDPLVDPFPKIDVIRIDPENMVPGFTLMELATDDAGYVVAFDDDFQPVWLTVDRDWQDVRVTEWGTLFGTYKGSVREETFLGEVVRRYDDEDPEATKVPFSFLHHGAWPFDDGTFLALAYGSREIPNYPIDYRDPEGPRAPATIRSTVFTHIAQNGEVLSSEDMADVLDPTRIGFDSIDPEGELHDWDRGNDIIPHHTEDRYIISLRNQDAIVKVNNTGTIFWILGDPAGWSVRYQGYMLRRPPDEPFVYSYHQRSPDWHFFAGAGKLIVMDNHAYGHTPYSPPPQHEVHARVVEYKVDEPLQGVRMVNSIDSFTTGETIVSNDLGSAMEIPASQNVLADFGLVTVEGGVPNADNGRGTYAVRVVEYFPGSQATPPLDVRLYSDAATRPYGWTSNRASRIEMLGEYGLPAPRTARKRSPPHVGGP